MRIGWLAVCVFFLLVSDASALSGAVVPITVAEGQLRGLPAAHPGRFAAATSPIAQVGDVNGDGVADVAVAAPSDDARGRRDAGAVYVLFGGAPLGRVDVSKAPGFRIDGPKQGKRRPLPVFQPDGAPEGAMAGSAVAGAGDVNGDGLADLIVGAPFAGRRERSFSGSAYVVFGKRTTTAVDLQRLGSGGFRIDGPRRDAAAGYAVAGPGDVNGDGRADVMVSAGIVQRPTVYVVHGKTDAAAVDLRRLAGRGFAIAGGRELGDVGASVSGAGDFNGDGLADMAIGAPQSGSATRDGSGFAFVLFGGAHRGTLDLERLGARGVRIVGEHEFANTGESLAPLGDVNGDGRGDLLIGASQVTAAEDRQYSGAAYVVYGRSAGEVDLLRPVGGAFRILGPRAGDGQARAGISVSSVPDVNGDGRTDLLIGAPGAGRRCSPDEGAAFVVFTPPGPTPLDLEDLGASGYAITGLVPASGAGYGVASAGDWNRDGRGDALILQEELGGDGPPRAPRVDIVLGRIPAPPGPPAALPTVEVRQPSLRRLASARGLDVFVESERHTTEHEFMQAELRTSAFGEEMLLAVAYEAATGPSSTRMRLMAPQPYRSVLRRRTRLATQLVFSLCTADGREQVLTQPLNLR